MISNYPQRFPIHGGTPFFRHCHPKDGGPSCTREVRYCRQPSAELYVQEPMRKCGWMAHSSPGVPANCVWSGRISWSSIPFQWSYTIYSILSFEDSCPIYIYNIIFIYIIYICICMYMYVYIICHCISRYIIVFNPWICWWVNQFALVTSPPFLQSRWNAESRSTSFSS